jgi:hypothetical protein
VKVGVVVFTGFVDGVTATCTAWRNGKQLDLAMKLVKEGAFKSRVCLTIRVRPRMLAGYGSCCCWMGEDGSGSGCRCRNRLSAD